jgi:hypothetical protein
MNDETLDRLLKDADADFSRPPPSLDVAGAVRRTDRRRRSRARVLTGVTVVALAVCGAWWKLHPSPNDVVKVDPPRVIHDLRAEADAARADADVRMAAVERMLAMEKSAARNARADALWEVMLQRDRAAAALLYRGDRYRNDMRPADAAVAYRRILELFPASAAAGEARKRLDEI